MMTTDELIVYLNSRNGLGIRILGTKRATNQSGIYIRQLLDGGLAQRDGRLKVGDQILSVNDETIIGINWRHAVNILRSAAITNHVRLHVQHFLPPLSSQEYQQLLNEERSIDDDEDIYQSLNFSSSKNRKNSHNRSLTTENEVQMRRSSHRRNHEHEKHRHIASNLSFREKNHQEEQYKSDQILRGLDISHEALQSLLNSRFKLIDLVALLKKIYPTLLLKDHTRELQFIQQLSQTNADGRITLKDFERQSSVLLGERINLLLPFYSSAKQISMENDNQLVDKLHREVALFRSRIDELHNKIIICEKSQRLSEQVGIEYEDLIKFLDEQLNQYKSNEINQLQQIQANHQLIEKLFYFLSIYLKQPKDEQISLQLKHEYEHQRIFLS
ncbi:unnamed protein product [Rotaria socialis]|uniref:PDZ domain-containing protein n=1 Tax=Rotaria socialis TaxID=392032 RepID=A0A817PU85_9BILA|nr:unnamed protein product [Rotaria socialis]CAF3408406.1 unnamed protein product [Rotaria socialis]CAF4405158.1 unnamed protein product [Rotaria socialis]CAF4582624.1 unnamed protein product [Rotaria socialis]